MIGEGHLKWVPLMVAALGTVLRVRAFVANPSLSIDEAAIARNLNARSLVHLFGPLDYAQVAPPGFLAIEKLATITLGQSEYALRAAPLACGLLSLWLCWSVSRRILPYAAAACALLLVSLNTAFIAYSITAKPYSGEVAASLLIVLVAVRLFDIRSSGAAVVWLGLAGAATILFSFTAVFVLAGAALTCALWSLGSAGPRRRRLLGTAGLWMLAAIAGGLIGRSVLSARDGEYMHWFWAVGFMPFPARSVHDALWILTQLRNLFGQTAHYRAATLWILLTLTGAISLWRRWRFAAWLLAAPFAIVIAASAARIYPFTGGRVQLFLLPLALIAAAEGAAAAWIVLRNRLPIAGVLPITVVMLLAGYSTISGSGLEPPQEVRPFLERATAEWRPGDVLYVYHGLGQAFLYYAPRFHFSPSDYVLGTCSRGSGRTYLRELDRLRGHSRVWVALPHLDDLELHFFVNYLNAIGRQTALRDRDEDADTGAAVRIGYLYDLSDVKRTAAITADSFSVPAALDNAAPYVWSCYGVFRPEESSGRMAAR